ncbi:MAG: TIR domain-containing protein [Chloroflexota bacterium]|nr:TIR domain-containing protein [Chloroflexota bacterium]
MTRSGREPAETTSDPLAEPYAAFVSYSHAPLDRRWASWLQRALETYRLPGALVQTGQPRRLGRVFRDEEELGASSDLSGRIDAALKRSRFLVVVGSPRSAQSRWVNEEVRRFQSHASPDRVLALLIEGEPSTAFPPALREVEPLAADVRQIAGGSARSRRRTARLKLVAALLDLPFDTLRRRDDERTRRRLAALATGAAVAAVVFLGLAGFALQQWRRAEAELLMSRAQTLALQAQAASAAASSPDDPLAPDPDRGVLLALESLRTRATTQAEQVLRAALRPLGRPALEAPLGEGEELAGIGRDAAWLLIRSDTGFRVLDLHDDTSRPATATQIQGASAIPAEPAREVEVRSPDGRLIVRASTEGTGGWVFATAEVVEADGGRRRALLPHEWHLRHAAFSDDSRYLMTVTGRASADAADAPATALVGSTVRVWDIASGRAHTEVSLAHAGGIDDLALSPDGAWLATLIAAPTGRIVLLWPLWPELLRKEACRRVHRNLSPSEWSTFMGTQPPHETCPGLPVVSE